MSKISTFKYPLDHSEYEKWSKFYEIISAESNTNNREVRKLNCKPWISKLL